MICTSCGREITGQPVMVVYGDEEFAHKRAHPGFARSFPLDRKCFERDKQLTVTRWANDDIGEPVLEEFQTTRYVEVES